MQELKLDLEPVLNAIGDFVVGEAVKHCPVDRGDLRRSIRYEIHGNEVVIIADAPGAESMEYGEPPHELNAAEKADVDKWAKRHGLESGFWVAQSIKKHGIKVGTPTEPLHITSLGRDSYRPYLRPAVYKNLGVIKRIVAENIR